MHNYKQLKIWQVSKDLVKDIYTITSTFPEEEKFGLTNQIRRAGVSILANIAEGAVRQTDKEFANFLNIALGSLNEVSTMIEISHDLKYIQNKSWEHTEMKIDELKKMIYTIIKNLRSKKS